MNEKEAIKV